MEFIHPSPIEYEVLERVATGGMASVYKAVAKGVEGFGKVVAIKRLSPELSGDPFFREMFIREAKLVADLIHENIVQIYHLQEDDHGGLFFVLEYVSGVSLGDLMLLLRSFGERLPRSLALFVASRVARGLAYAHSKRRDGRLLRIVHCDVSPRNILISNGGVVKITDFGIARALTMMEPKEGEVFGSVPFMSPEQARGEKLDGRSDIYSLGVLLFSMLCGKLPRRLGTEVEMLEEAAGGKVDWGACEELDDEVLRVLKKSLAPERDARYKNAGEFSMDLDAIVYRRSKGPGKAGLSSYLEDKAPYMFRDEREARNTLAEIATTVVCPGMRAEPKKEKR